MADITMCIGDNCPIKETCYRFTSKSSSPTQMYFDPIPGKWGWRREEFANGDIFDHREFQCEMFLGRNNTEFISELNNVKKEL